MKSKKKIYLEICNFIKKELDFVQNITPNTLFENIDIDSLDLLILITKFEKQYKIKLKMEELVKIKKIIDLVKIVHSKLK